MIITTRQKHQRLPILNYRLMIGNHPILRVNTIRFLGVLIIDESLSWSSQIHDLVSKLARSTYLLARIKHFIDIHCRKAFYYAFIHSKLEYSILIWRCSI